MYDTTYSRNLFKQRLKGLEKANLDNRRSNDQEFQITSQKERLEIPSSTSISCKEKKSISPSIDDTFRFHTSSIRVSKRREERQRVERCQKTHETLERGSGSPTRYIFGGFVFSLAFLGQPQVQKGSCDLAWFRE